MLKIPEDARYTKSKYIKYYNYILLNKIMGIFKCNLEDALICIGKKYDIRNFSRFLNKFSKIDKDKILKNHKQTKKFKRKIKNFRHLIKFKNWFSDPEFQEKRKKTMLEKYGYEFSMQDPKKSKEIISKIDYKSISEKTKQTKIEKYGFKEYNNIEKQKITNINKDYSKINSKIRDTFLKKYNIPNISQKNIKNFENYNINYIKENFIENNKFKLKEFLDYFQGSKSNSYKIKKRFNITEPNFDRLEYEFLNTIESKYNIKLERQFRIYIDDSNYYMVDGFDVSSNTVYEFLGDFWHGRSQSTEINPISKRTFKELYDETFNRFSDLSKLGYKIKYIWESDYLDSGLELLKFIK